MGKRGRGANRGLTIVPSADSPGDVISFPRAKPPIELNEEEKVEWGAITKRLPAEHFRTENLPLLTQYCRHIVKARKVSMLLHQEESGPAGLDLELYDRLLKMQERESRCLASLATKMRLSQQAVYSARKTRPTSGPKPPWEDPE